MNDTEYIFLLRPNGHGEHAIALGGEKTKKVSLKVSSQGIRDRIMPPKAVGEFRIAMLGDSYTMGHAVNDEDTIPRQLEKRLATALPEAHVQVMNCGIGGGGTLQELGMLRRRVLALEPDLVILQLYPGNDVDNALEVVNKRQRSYNQRWHRNLANYRHKNRVQIRAERWMADHARAYQALQTMTQRRWIQSFIEELRWVKDAYAPLAPSESRPDLLEVDLAQWYPELEEGLSILEDHVLQMRKECQARGIGFMAYCVPTVDEVSDRLWTSATSSLESPVQYERLKGANLLDAFFSAQSIPHVSIVKALREAGPIENMYYLYDGHLAELGNAVVAQVWADYLAGDYLKNVRPAKSQE